MAVFTPVSLSDLQPFWAAYNLGELAEAASIAEGVQNTNYRLTTTHGTRYILTLLEKWVDAAALPFYVGAMAHLAAKGVACPLPQGTPPIRTLANRPAVVGSFLRGQQATALTPGQAHHAGRALVSLHLAAADFEGVHDNAYGAQHWPAWASWHGMLGTTFGGSYLACAACLAVLEVMSSEKLIEHAGQLGEAWIRQLRALPDILAVRGRGLMIGFDLPPSRKDLRTTLLNVHHIFTGEAKPHTIRLLPSLAITEEEGQVFFNALARELQ